MRQGTAFKSRLLLGFLLHKYFVHFFIVRIQPCQTVRGLHISIGSKTILFCGPSPTIQLSQPAKTMVQ